METEKNKNEVGEQQQEKENSWEDQFIEAEAQRFKDVIFTLLSHQNVFQDLLELDQSSIERMNAGRYLQVQNKNETNVLDFDPHTIVDVKTPIKKYFADIRFGASRLQFEKIKKKLKNDLEPIVERIIDAQYKESRKKANESHRWAEYFSSGKERSSVYKYRPYFGDLLEIENFESQKPRLIREMVSAYIDDLDPRTKEEKEEQGNRKKAS